MVTIKYELRFLNNGLIKTLMKEISANKGIHTKANINSNDYVVDVPVTLKRCGMETRLVIQSW